MRAQFVIPVIASILILGAIGIPNNVYANVIVYSDFASFESATESIAEIDFEDQPLDCGFGFFDPCPPSPQTINDVTFTNPLSGEIVFAFCGIPECPQDPDSPFPGGSIGMFLNPEGTIDLPSGNTAVMMELEIARAIIVEVTNSAGTETFLLDPMGERNSFLGFTSLEEIQQIRFIGTAEDPFFTFVLFTLYHGTASPEHALNDLITEIEELDLTKPSEKSLTQKLNGAIKMLTDKNDKNDLNSCNKLNDFVNQVNAQEGKGLTTPQADSLRDSADSIKALIGCP